MTKNFPFEVRAKFIKDALRQLNYTNYTAIADIVDNSLEPNVESENIYIKLFKAEDKKTVKQIMIADDGCGMDEATLCMAMSLGSETGKSKDYNLGCYGAGLKTASISIGTKFSVYSKTEYGELFVATLDLDDISADGKLNVNMETYNDETDEAKFFAENTKSTHGTIVLISNLDRIQCKDFRGFEGTLTKQMRIFFNKYIESGVCKFYVNDKELTFFDTIGNKSGLNVELMDEGMFEYDGSRIEWRAWYLPKNIQDAEFDNFLGRTNENAGIYVYRQKRLVGKGLDLGLCSKSSHWTNGFRFELFMDGNADKLFGTTFAKMITEKDKSSIEQGFYDTLQPIVKPLANQCNKRQHKESEGDKVSDDIKKSLIQTTERLNKNILLASSVKQKGKNEKRDEHKEKNPNPKPQVNPNPTRKRSGEWIGGFEFVSEGQFGFMYDIDMRGGKAYVLINQDHAFYEKVFKNLDEDSRYNISAFLACEYQAKQKSDYWDNNDAQKFIKNYKDAYGEAVRRAFLD